MLKSPAHIWCLHALLAEYAVLVQTHRDPLRIVSSLSSLIATLRRVSSDDATIAGAAAEFAEYILDGLHRSVTAREDGTVRARVVDVNFAAFMADPLATIRSVYDRLGLELSVESETRMRAFRARNPADLHGTPLLVGRHGLDAGNVRERAPRCGVLRRAIGGGVTT